MKDPVLRRLGVEIFNDSRAEIQEQHQQPAPAHAHTSGLGHRGMRARGAADLRTGAPGSQHDLGPPGPRLTGPGQRAWDPLWEVCADLELPMHFHIGASLTAMNFFGQYFWESQDEYVKPAIGGAMLFIGNARVVINTIFSGHLRPLSEAQDGFGGERDRLGTLHPRDHGLGTARERPRAGGRARRPPSEYFKSNWYATMWFETGRGHLQELVDKVGEDNIMFETDFPHPTASGRSHSSTSTRPWRRFGPSRAARSSPRTGRSSTAWVEASESHGGEWVDLGGR